MAKYSKHIITIDDFKGHTMTVALRIPSDLDLLKQYLEEYSSLSVTKVAGAELLMMLPGEVEVR